MIFIFNLSCIFLSCADSPLLMMHPSQIFQKYIAFGESVTHPLAFVKSPSNIGIFGLFLGFAPLVV